MTSLDTPRHVILVDRVSLDEREAIHAVVKEHSRGWWHHFADSWIVGGHTAANWRDWIGAVKGSTSDVLVLTLPSDQRARRWAARGPRSAKSSDWIKGNYRP